VLTNDPRPARTVHYLGAVYDFWPEDGAIAIWQGTEAGEEFKVVSWPNPKVLVRTTYRTLVTP
jgi:hypothetical protein